MADGHDKDTEPRNDLRAASAALHESSNAPAEASELDPASAPLPEESPPSDADDGWQPHWDNTNHAWWFHNRKTNIWQWENPRVPSPVNQNHRLYDKNPPNNTATCSSSSGSLAINSHPKRLWGGYNPAIHGSYDPNADYAKEAAKDQEEADQNATTTASTTTGLSNPYDPAYVAEAHFNRFTGKFQQPDAGPEMHNDENKSKRQLGAYFDVDKAANSHQGRSLKEERRNKTLTKKEIKAFKEKRRSKKEEKRRALYRD